MKMFLSKIVIKVTNKITSDKIEMNYQSGRQRLNITRYYIFCVLFISVISKKKSQFFFFFWKGEER